MLYVHKKIYHVLAIETESWLLSFLTFNGGISTLPMTPYNSNLAVKTALLRVGAGERRAGLCWDTSLDFYPPPPPPPLNPSTSPDFSPLNTLRGKQEDSAQPA